MRRLTSTQIGLIVAGVFILAFALWTYASTRRDNPDRLPDNIPANATAISPAKRCAAQSTYDLIKRELFRRAAALRGSDQAAFDRLAAYAVVRVDRPVLEREDVTTGAIGCAGALTLDLPPGVAVVGGRRSLEGDVEYTLQRAADGNGEVLTLTSADAIVTPLATLARVGAARVDPLAPVQNGMGADPLAPDPESPPPPEPGLPLGQPALPQVERPAASPSFDCRDAHTRGELAVCRDTGLAALDRQMAGQFVAARRSADGAQRALLDRTRVRFLRYRDSCRNDACVADAYRGRMAEIGDIMAGRWSPR